MDPVHQRTTYRVFYLVEVTVDHTNPTILCACDCVISVRGQTSGLEGQLRRQQSDVVRLCAARPHTMAAAIEYAVVI